MCGGAGGVKLDSERLLRNQYVTEFLYREAALLDAWQLDEWLTLFTEDATYVVPGTDNPDADPREALVLISDDHARLAARVKRLLGGHAFREFPWSRTRRIVANVLSEPRPDGAIVARASIAVYRFRANQNDFFIGRSEHVLVDRDGELKIASKRVMIDQETLNPNGALSMIL